jgi:hypothetical protein
MPTLGGCSNPIRALGRVSDGGQTSRPLGNSSLLPGEIPEVS